MQREANRQRKIDRGEDPDGPHVPTMHLAIPQEPLVEDHDSRFRQLKRQRRDEAPQLIDVKFKGELLFSGRVEETFILMAKENLKFDISEWF